MPIDVPLSSNVRGHRVSNEMATQLSHLTLLTCMLKGQLQLYEISNLFPNPHQRELVTFGK